MKFIKDKEWLLKNLDQKDVRIIDCRFALSNPELGKQEYDNSHIPGAVYFDLEKDLSSQVSSHGGRHPMPEINKLKEKLEIAGIDENTTIVAYDNGEGAYAARFWWMLTYLGHKRVYVLDGGYKNWLKSNYPTTSDVPVFDKSEFHVDVQSYLLADVKEVQEVVSSGNPNIILIDSRENKRYLGIEEPIDKKKGHIPGAINKPWMEGLRDGYYHSMEEQKLRFSSLDPDKELIVYCGSGVTAVPNLITLKEAGFEKVRLYLGSFSDWISYEENKIK
ncbi:sulfurtransferase [Robertmurraya korlensis]|uniref:sulfurtransferase n=1 Tax=Robertmurraya korlensis TaxID=519977 RepID=UPI000825FE8B|nr:sulfurtransferase [Robertmurraya korlensis]